MKNRNLDLTRASELLGVSRSALSNILNGRRDITPDLALTIESVFGGTTSLWLPLQSSYDTRNYRVINVLSSLACLSVYWCSILVLSMEFQK
ncbi:addiction module antidote protein, HigA family [Pedobacter jejuensis]|uniref:Addiction module antidote protein, HigA family n=1 Tax=Pedobacter jejuensis TaxID=1268550 RepID=A0A3N0BRL9_9SPHI|nr:addiction module antidote protein, HigA family [Pedobacter jejuensis]